MSAIAPITVIDGSATPVSRVFTPSTNKNGVAVFVDRSVGIALGAPYVTISIVPATKTSPYNKVEARSFFPTLEVTAGNTGSGIQAAPQLAYVLGGITTYRAHVRSTKDERKRLRVMHENFIKSAPMLAAIDDLEGLWG